jgi:hypothetical protein
LLSQAGHEEIHLMSRRKAVAVAEKLKKLPLIIFHGSGAV